MAMAVPAAAADLSPYRMRDCIAEASALIAFGKAMQNYGAGITDDQLDRLGTLRDGWVNITINTLECRSLGLLSDAIEGGQKDVRDMTAKLGTRQPQDVWNRQMKQIRTCADMFGLDATRQAATATPFDLTTCQKG